MSAKKSDKPQKQKPAKKAAKKEQELQQHLDELTADLKRVQADFINYKRRTETERERAAAAGKETVVRALLPVVDNIERALGNVPEKLAKDDYVKGVGSIAKQLQKALADIGVQKIETVGKEFDAELMEAVSMENEGGNTDIVSDELQAGYVMGETVIRHAMVKVKRS